MKWHKISLGRYSMAGTTYLLVGDGWEGSNQIVDDGYLQKNRPDAVIIRARDYPDIAEAMKQIKPPVGNVEIHAHGSSDGTISWAHHGAHGKINPSYTDILGGLPEGVQGILIHSCYGGSAEATKFLQAAPAGATVISMAGPDTVGSTEAIRKYMANSDGRASPAETYLQALNAYDPAVFVKNSDEWKEIKKRNDLEGKHDASADTYGAVGNKNPVDYLPHIIGIGGGQRIDLATELAALPQKNPQFLDQAVAKTESRMTTATHADIAAVADKIRHGEKLGTAPNPIDAARELRVAYAITAEYMDVSGELAQRQKAALDGHTQRRAPLAVASNDDGYGPYTHARLEEEVNARYASVRTDKKGNVEVVLDRKFLNTPGGQAFQKAMLSNGALPADISTDQAKTFRELKPHADGNGGVAFTVPKDQMKYGGIVGRYVSAINNGLEAVDKADIAVGAAKTNIALAQNPITTSQGAASSSPATLSVTAVVASVPKETGEIRFNSKFAESRINPASGKQEVTLSKEFLNSPAGERFKDFLNPTAMSVSNWLDWTTRPELKGVSVEAGADGGIKLSFAPSDPRARAEAMALQQVMGSASRVSSTGDLGSLYRGHVKAAERQQAAIAPTLVETPTAVPMQQTRSVSPLTPPSLVEKDAVVPGEAGAQAPALPKAPSGRSQSAALRRSPENGVQDQPHANEAPQQQRKPDTHHQAAAGERPQAKALSRMAL